MKVIGLVIMAVAGFACIINLLIAGNIIAPWGADPLGRGAGWVALAWAAAAAVGGWLYFKKPKT